MNNIMLDLEALDSKRTAVIVSIGAVYFDLEKNILGNEFYMEVSLPGLKEQLGRGRTQSLETMIWWMQQSDQARKVFWPSKEGEQEKENINFVLRAFRNFCAECEKPKVWGNGVDYDNMVLRDCYETFGIHAPWHYGDNRCYRTIKNLFGNRAKLERVGAHHNGLDDAKTQAVHLMKMLSKARG